MKGIDNMKKGSHRFKVAKMLLAGKRINQIDILKKLGNWRLASIIYDLKRCGLDISVKMNRIATYHMTPEAIEDAHQKGFK